MKQITLLLIVLLLSDCGDYNTYNIQNTEPEFGVVTDIRDGYEYGTVTLNNQTWLAENLRYLPDVSPSSVGSATIKHYYVYAYEGTDVVEAMAEDNYGVYGALYNWEAAMNACPAGWHLPSDDEWKTLEFVLGMDAVDAERIEWRLGGEVGKKLKSAKLWSSDLGGDNSSGFNALPAGNKNGVPQFNDITKWTNFWSSTPNGDEQAYYRGLTYGMDGVFRNGFFRTNGFSVRCLKN